jgi:lipopolysaccharide export system permease protein
LSIVKIIDLYLVRHFLKPLGACVAIFVILVLIGRFFDKMDILTNFHARSGDIILFLILGLPYWLNLVFPVATLLALMFSLGQLQQHGEITAMRGAGISNFRLFAPFMVLGIIISGISLIGGLTFLPALNTKSTLIYRQHIKHEQVSSTQRDHVVATGLDHRRFTIGWLDSSTGLLKDVVIDQFDSEAHLLTTLSAQEGQYQHDKWTFRHGTFIHFDANGAFIQDPFEEKTLGLPEKLKDFVFDDKKADELTQTELKRRIGHLRELGIPSFKEQVGLHLKYALPFANVVVILLGIPFAIKTAQKGRVQTIAYAMGTTFLYWGMVSACQSLGEQGHLPGWISAWMANFIFAGLAVWMLRKT